jgi:superfamily II DNA/RNA helicase
MNFDELNLAPAILKAVREQGYETPTPIQQQAIPAVLAGHDLLAGAQTGTGKTAAFTLPMLHKLTMSRSATNRFGVLASALWCSPPPVNSPRKWKSRSATTANTCNSNPPSSLVALA